MKKFSSNNFLSIAAIILFGICIIILIWRQQLGQLKAERETIISQGVQQNDNLALALENYTTRTIQSADILLNAIRSEYEIDQVAPDYNKLLQKPYIDSGLVNGISIINAEGRIISSNFDYAENPALNFSDRSYFTVHKQTTADQLFISKTVHSVTLKKPIIFLSRRIGNKDGSFGGIVSIQIVPFTFTRFYEGAIVEKDDIVSLIAPDGITYVRRTGRVPGYGENISKSPLFVHVAKNPVGNYYAKDAIKGVSTYFSYRKLKNYPIIATIGKAEQDLLKFHTIRARQEIITTAGITLLIVVFVVIICIGLVRRKQYISVLQASEARYRLMFENSKDAFVLFNDEGDVQAMNPAAVKVFNIENSAGINQINIAQLLYPVGTKEQFLPNIIDSVQSLNGEHRFFRNNGSSFLGELIVSSYVGYNGKKMYMAAIRDFTEKRELQRKLILERRTRLQLINRQVIEAQEKERESIGRELHDNVCQLLSTAKLFLGLVKKEGDSDNVLLPRSLKLLDESIEEIRMISHQLMSSSFGDRSLEEAIQDLISVINESNAVHVHFNTPHPGINPDSEIKQAIFRILQEQMSNILKHASATDVVVTLDEKDDILFFTISDNGVGFDTSLSRKGIGLNNIESRASAYGGTMKLTSSPGQGCRLMVKFPLDSKNDMKEFTTDQSRSSSSAEE